MDSASLSTLPDIIQAAGVAFAAVIAAWTAMQGNKIRKLRIEMDELKSQFERIGGKFRFAIWHIRDWQRWEMRAEPRGNPPELPLELKDEV